MGAGGHHAQGVTLPAVPVVEDRPRLPEVPASAGPAVWRLPAQGTERARHDGRGEWMSEMSAAIERLRFAVRTLPGVLAGFSEAESEQRPSPERWTKKEVIGQLIDSASNNHQRFVRGQLTPGQGFPRYEQEGWVRVQDYQSARWADLIDLWRA